MIEHNSSTEQIWVDKINEVYTERNMCVSLIVRMAMAHGFKTGVRPDKDWPIVFVELPAGQVSWHIPETEFHKYFPSMNEYDGEYDRHTTEEKYRRVTLDYDRQWEETLNSPHGKRIMGALLQEARGEILAGETEEGGFGLE